MPIDAPGPAEGGSQIDLENPPPHVLVNRDPSSDVPMALWPITDTPGEYPMCPHSVFISKPGVLVRKSERRGWLVVKRLAV